MHGVSIYRDCKSHFCIIRSSKRDMRIVNVPCTLSGNLFGPINRIAHHFHVM